MLRNSEPCIFLKYRNLIKYEDFYNNHPVIYLPFVCLNFLLVSLLPSVYNEESSMLENSRIKLLQNHKLVLKILQTFINCTLDINIVLQEEKFDESVEKLKRVQTESSITIDSLYSFLFPEYYMNETDVTIYRSKLGSFFPKKIVFQSRDLIPCQNFFKEMETVTQLSGVQIWGPPMWTVTHFTCYVIDNYKSEDYKSKEYMASLSGIFDLFIPCSFCREHYRGLENSFQAPDIIKKDLRNLQRPFPITLPLLALKYAKKNQLFDFFSSLHFHCKPLIDSNEPLSIEYYKHIYSKFWKETVHKNE